MEDSGTLREVFWVYTTSLNAGWESTLQSSSWLQVRGVHRQEWEKHLEVCFRQYFFDYHPISFIQQKEKRRKKLKKSNASTSHFQVAEGNANKSLAWYKGLWIQTMITIYKYISSFTFAPALILIVTMLSEPWVYQRITVLQWDLIS